MRSPRAFPHPVDKVLDHRQRDNGFEQGDADFAQRRIHVGIAQRAERLKAGATPAQRDAIEAALKRLIAPSEMGNLFKVMGLSQAGGPPLPGFAP